LSPGGSVYFTCNVCALPAVYDVTCDQAVLTTDNAFIQLQFTYFGLSNVCRQEIPTHGNKRIGISNMSNLPLCNVDVIFRCASVLHTITLLHLLSSFTFLLPLLFFFVFFLFTKPSSFCRSCAVLPPTPCFLNVTDNERYLWYYLLPCAVPVTISCVVTIYVPSFKSLQPVNLK